MECILSSVPVHEILAEGNDLVSVVDPGVGTARRSCVSKTCDGYYIVIPDNGTLTHIKKYIGIEEVREISETTNRRKNTEASYTFHGRDVYAFTGTKLTTGKITFWEVGPAYDPDEILELSTVETEISDHCVKGTIDILDVCFGSLWTSITREEFLSLHAEYGERLEVSIYNHDNLVYQNGVIYGRSFADVRIGAPIIYINSVYRVGLAINQGSFAKAYNIGVGQQWSIEIRKIR